MPAFITDNPVAITTFISTVLAVAVAFGFHMSDDQRNAILALAAALIVLGTTAHKVTVPKSPSSAMKLKSLQKAPK